MGILMGIVSFILGFAINLLDSAVELMLNAIGYDMTTFLTIFPFAQNAVSTFTACGLAFLTLGLIWQAMKGFGAPFGIEYENPLHVVGKVALAWFAVVNLTPILNIFTNLFQIVLDDMNNQQLNPSFGSDYVIDGLISSLAFGLMDSTGIISIVYVIFSIVLGWKFIKLLIESVERYIVYCFIWIIGPVFVPTMAFKGTKNIADTWFRAFFGQSLLILLNTWSVKMFLSYMQLFSQNPEGVLVSGVGRVFPIVMLFFGFAFLNFASRIDSFLRILGLNTAHTGAGMGSSMLGGVTKMLMAVKGMQSMGGALSGAASAAKGAGGIGTAEGMKAAAASFFGGGGSGSGSASTIGGISTAEGGTDTNRRADGSKADPDAPGRRMSDVGTGVERSNGVPGIASGNLLKQEPTPSDRMMAGQREISSALNNNQVAPDQSKGIGATNGISNFGNKADYVDGGVMSSAGRQGELANQHHGGSKPMGEIKQDSLTANAVRAAATSAERTDLGVNGQPIAAYSGQEAAAAMNGNLAFGNENLKDFNHAVDTDGTSGISGMNFQDGSSVTFDNVSGGIASGVYTDSDGNSTAFDLVHDNAVASMEAAQSNSGNIGSIHGDSGSSSGTSYDSASGFTNGNNMNSSGNVGGIDGTNVSAPDGGKTYDSAGGIGHTGIAGSTGSVAGIDGTHSSEASPQMEFDKSAAVGRIGDGSGDTGFYVVPKAASDGNAATVPYGHAQSYSAMGATVDYSNPTQVQQATQNLSQFVSNCNPVDKAVPTFADAKLEQMQKSASGSTPKTKQQKRNRN